MYGDFSAVRPIAREVFEELEGSLPQVNRNLDFIEQELARSEWLAGEAFTAADIQMSYPLEAAEKRVGFGERRRLAEYVRRLRERPAYQRAQQRGGEFGVPAFDD